MLCVLWTYALIRLGAEINIGPDAIFGESRWFAIGAIIYGILKIAVKESDVQ